MSGAGKQKALARRLERDIAAEELAELAKQKEGELEVGCSCRPIHCAPRIGMGALILRVPDPHCFIHGTPRKTFSEMTAAEFLEALRTYK